MNTLYAILEMSLSRQSLALVPNNHTETSRRRTYIGDTQHDNA